MVNKLQQRQQSDLHEICLIINYYLVKEKIGYFSISFKGDKYSLKMSTTIETISSYHLWHKLTAVLFELRTIPVRILPTKALVPAAKRWRLSLWIECTFCAEIHTAGHSLEVLFNVHNCQHLKAWETMNNAN